MSKSTSGLDKQMDDFLRELGAQGALESCLSDDDWKHLVTTAQSVVVSVGFAQRAMTAMIHAQAEREQRSPAVALGTLLARSRHKVALESAQIAEQIGVPVTVLEALEIGQLSARQLLYSFSPMTAVRFLAAIKLTVEEFSDRLMNWVATGGQAAGLPAPQLVHRKQHSDSELLVQEVAAYVAALERLNRQT